MELRDVQVVKEEDDTHARDEEQKINKSIQAYKDTMTLIKLKMNKADTLIRQYNDKMKECDLLNDELSMVRTEKQDIFGKYNLTLEKAAKLELENKDYKQSIDKFKGMTENQKIKLEENEQHIHQLVFKIKSMEGEISTLQDDNKSLQADIKSNKVVTKVIEKKPQVQLKNQESQTTIAKRDTSVNTDPIQTISKKPETQEKMLMTDECINIKKEPFPIFCSKCETRINPAPIEQILKIMTSHVPLLPECLSPPTSPKFVKASDEICDPIENDMPAITQNISTDSISHVFENTDCVSPFQDSKNSSYSFMQIDKLARKVNKLENSIKNKKNKQQSNCCHNSCFSKNIKFVVKLPNEKQFFEHRKREKRKLKRLQQLKNKNITLQRKPNLEKNLWLVEEVSKPKKRKLASKKDKKMLNKKRKVSNPENDNDLFDSPEVTITNVKSKTNGSHSENESLSPSNFSDIESTHTSINENLEENCDEIEKFTIQNPVAHKSNEKSKITSSSSIISQTPVNENFNRNIVQKGNKQKNLVHNKKVKETSLANSHNVSIEKDSTERYKEIVEATEKNQQNNLALSVANEKLKMNEKMCVTQNGGINNFTENNSVNSMSFKKSSEFEICNYRGADITNDEKIQENGTSILVSNKQFDSSKSIFTAHSSKISNIVENVQENVLLKESSESHFLKSKVIDIIQDVKVKENTLLIPICNEDININESEFIAPKNTSDYVDPSVTGKCMLLEKSSKYEFPKDIGTTPLSDQEISENYSSSPEYNEKENGSISIDQNNASNDEIHSPNKNLSCNSSPSSVSSVLSKMTEQLIHENVKDINKRQNRKEEKLPVLKGFEEHDCEISKKLEKIIGLSNVEIQKNIFPASNNKLNVNESLSIAQSSTSNEIKNINESSVLRIEPLNSNSLSTLEITNPSVQKDTYEIVIKQENIPIDNLETIDSNYQYAHKLPVRIRDNEVSPQKTPLYNEELDVIHKVPTKPFCITNKVLKDKDESSQRKLFSMSTFTPALADNNTENIKTLENRQETTNLATERDNYECKHTLLVETENTEKRNQIDYLSIDENSESTSFIEISNDKISVNENLFTGHGGVMNKQIENTKEKYISSDESSESKFFSASGIKRGMKCTNTINIILSDESSEEKSVEELSTTKRKRLNKYKPIPTNEKRKKLSKIGNTNIISKKPILIAKSDSCSSQIKEISSSSIPLTESSNDSNLSIEIPHQSSKLLPETPDCTPKKQRIAHTPKNTIATTNIKTVTPTIRKTKSNIKNQSEETGDTISSIMKDYDKTCKERKRISRSLKTPEHSMLELSPFKALISNNLVTSTIPCRKSSLNNENVNQLIKQEICDESTEFTTDINMLQPNTIKKENDVNEIILDKIKEEVVNEDPSIVQCSTSEQSIIQSNSEPVKPMRRRKILSKNLQKSPIRELRSRQVVIKEESIKDIKLKINNQPLPKLIDETNSSLKNTIVVSYLNDFISEPNYKNNIRRNRMAKLNSEKNKKFIDEQLTLLMKSEQWTSEINLQVLENLLNLQDLRTISLYIIEYAAMNLSNEEAFDKSHTPPAPIMTRSEQKIVTLILTISKKHAEFSEIIINGIQYKLFRLGHPQDVQIVERLFRILVVLNKIKKDREKVRLFCCDALYCLSLRATNIIYVALTCWPEIFPKHDSNNDIIVKTIVHIVMTLQVNRPYPKLNSLKKLLSTHYEYPNCGYMTNDFRDELFQNLKENVPGVNTAILLLCKQMRPTWSLQNVIKGGLTEMIVKQELPSTYEALNLLGNILRSFPTADSSSAVANIIEQLCDVLAGTPGADDLQEGVVSCLLSISKFKFEQIARSVIEWQSNKNLRPATQDKLRSFFSQHDAKWWWKFVQTNFPLPK